MPKSCPTRGDGDADRNGERVGAWLNDRNTIVTDRFTGGLLKPGDSPSMNGDGTSHTAGLSFWHKVDDLSTVSGNETIQDGTVSEIGFLDVDAKSSTMGQDSESTVKPSDQLLDQPDALPVGWPDRRNDPTRPFPFFHRLPLECREKIIAFGCPAVFNDCECAANDSPRPFIRPTYYASTVQCPPRNNQVRKNIAEDSGLLSIYNHSWQEAVTGVLYGFNTYVLKEPKAARWWLEQIGPSNLAKIKHLKMHLTVGLLDPSFGTYNELLWCKLLQWLKNRQQLKAVDISFSEWRMYACGKDWQWREQARWREESVLALLGWRGLEAVNIKRGHWHRNGDEWKRFNGGRRIWDAIKDAMRLEPGEMCESEKMLKAVIKADWKKQGLKGERYSFT
ncbi:uncharacterized protein KY384_004319 [Bacidia gigantensis]|uniref:uncharacterized protein n=1 Tax=Bacidia gigantensis TaxID=2732470 RepID=UPI001D03E1CF|nr:uncharacterized protein KY384_004319 [Bacidia gigantensis]KAG8530962.1 hypothetical protein KY384_004319 [Bacidia gigantensis]